MSKRSRSLIGRNLTPTELRRKKQYSREKKRYVKRLIHEVIRESRLEDYESPMEWPPVEWQTPCWPEQRDEAAISAWITEVLKQAAGDPTILAKSLHDAEWLRSYLARLVDICRQADAYPIERAGFEDALTKVNQFIESQYKPLPIPCPTVENQEGPSPSPRSIEVCPGGIRYGQATVDLRGKPLACIKALLDAYDNRLDCRTLKERVWGEGSYTDKNTIKNIISAARDALRQLARQAGKHINKHFDPIPCVDHGKDLAWKLDFPQ
jgi:hypothetical protein